MPDRLPPLTALRAFEAAARHMSFAKAAEELNVTPAALSFQIKSLEEHLGHPVFHRLNRAVSLTEAGAALAPGVADGFDALNLAWRSARRESQNNVLNITAGPAFTSKWLAPRLYDFAQQNPEIELRFAASLRLLDLERDEIDVAIRFSALDPTDAYFEPFLREWMTPMMTPALAETFKKPGDLEYATLLHQDHPSINRQTLSWSSWFTAENLGPVPLGGPRFDQADHAIDAAIAGAGVVLGRISVAEKALSDGTLVAPFPTTLITRGAYRLICAHGAEKRPHVAAFLNWARQAVIQMKHFDEGRTLIPAGTFT